MINKTKFSHRDQQFMMNPAKGYADLESLNQVFNYLHHLFKNSKKNPFLFTNPCPSLTLYLYLLRFLARNC